MKKLPILLTLSLLTLGTAMSYAANNSSDNASNYSSFGDPTPNNGTGFGAWSFQNSGGGEYLGGTGLGANTFGVYAGSTSGYGLALRQFTGGALTTGQTFSLQLGATTIQSGAVGINLLDGANTVFTLQAGTGSSNWQLNDGGTSAFDTTIPFAVNTPVSFSFTYDGGNNYNVNMTEGANTYSTTVFTATNTLSDITGVKLFSAFQGGGENTGFNNLAITSPTVVTVPEPSTWAMLLGGVTGLAFVARRRKA